MLYLCTHGTGQNSLGNGFTLTMQVCLYVQYFSLQLMHTPNDGSRDSKLCCFSSYLLVSMINVFFIWLSKVMITDNGTCFTSSEFALFAECNIIVMCKLVCITHLAMACQRELSKPWTLEQLSGTIQTKLSCFLFHYRLTPHTTTGVAPVELLLK